MERTSSQDGGIGSHGSPLSYHIKFITKNNHHSELSEIKLDEV